MLLITVGIIGTILIVLGLIGCLVPALPGPPLSYAALLILALVQKFQPPLTGALMLVMLGVMIVMAVLDYFIPALGAKMYGSSKWGVWGAMLGMLFGAISFPPLGLLVGAFVGAIVAELAAGKPGKDALRAGWGVFLGTMAGSLLKLIVTGLMAYYFYAALF
ncbi:MAG: DUF456 domain-containing protein [Candidatus Zhuqueibacterota bacterium]